MRRRKLSFLKRNITNLVFVLSKKLLLITPCMVYLRVRVENNAVHTHLDKVEVPLRTKALFYMTTAICHLPPLVWAVGCMYGVNTIN